MSEQTVERGKVRKMTMCALFTALIVVGAFIRVPVPVVPFTLQLLFTMSAGLFLGAELGAMSVLLYIFLGLAGLPVFTEGGGPMYLFKPTFGYIIGFAVGAYVTGKIANKVSNPSFFRALWANFAGLLVVYGFGMVYVWGITTYYLGTGISLWNLFFYCFFLAVPGDILLCILAAMLAKRILPIQSLWRG